MGSKGYTHHFARVRMGQDGHDTDLEIMLTDLECALSLLNDIAVGLRVLGISNKLIDLWLDTSRSYLRENTEILNSLIDKLGKLPRMDEARFYSVLIKHGEGDTEFIPGYNDANLAIAAASLHDNSWVQEMQSDNIIWTSGSPIPTYKKRGG